MKIDSDANALFIFVTTFFIFSDSFDLNCPPVKEGADVIVKTNITQNQTNTGANQQLNFNFYRNDLLICNCLLGNQNTCLNKIAMVSGKICITTNQTKSQFNTITFFNITSWKNISSKTFTNDTLKMQFNQVNKTCDIKFYAFRGKPECHSNISSENVKIMCFLNNVFPEAKCEFEFTPNESFTMHEMFASNVPAGDYYNSTCTLNFSMPQNVIYKVKVTMYPNITNNESDLQYGQSTEFNLQDSKVTPTETSTKQETDQTSYNFSKQNNNTFFNEKLQGGFNIVLVLTASVVCLLIFITVAVIVTFLIIRRRKVYFVETNCCTCCCFTSNYKNLGHNQKVTEINNAVIYTLTLPRLKNNIGDSYSNVNIRQMLGFTVNHSDGLSTAILKVNQSKKLDAGYENCTNVTGVNLQNNVKVKEQDVYFNGDIIEPSVTNMNYQKSAKGL